ncbi:hypothetical protein QUA70_12085 [Microcoleus sp. LAD1_D5]|uniref:hypothetical protein n=1 Tax=unclassified Microcoleus TaxID=2642155 RepID=UPI002FD3E9AC
MSFETESNLSVFEAQTSDELSFEELESVAGGLSWNGVKEGIRDQLQGFGDGAGGRNDNESNLNYLGGHALGSIVRAVGGAVGSVRGK